MPRRQHPSSRSALTQASSKPRSKKAKSRSLDAFAIAGKQLPEQIKTRKNRLGQMEDSEPRRRPRNEDESEDGEEDAPVTKRPRKGDRPAADSDRGSDSEGNEWMMGQVDSDNDESIDSDEAMDESDEEKFEGFVFRGSSSTGTRKGPKKHQKQMLGGDQDIDLDEDEPSGSEESDDLGDDAVDLADMLDAEGATISQGKRSQPRQSILDDEGYSMNEEDDDEQGSSDEESSLSISEDEDDPSRLSALQTLISSLQPDSTVSKLDRKDDPHESNVPSEFGVNARQKVTVSDLMSTVTDPRLKKSLKLLSDSKSSSKRQGIPGKLQAPLPKRQQDSIDRAVAFEKSKETLNRWIDTIKHNRRADHLSFPLADATAPSIKGSSKLVSTESVAPMTDLESTIRAILEESGLAPEPGKTAEDKVQEFEELEAKKLPLEEVQARRAELRKARELLFREEVRAKRIKKIKSKSYRRVHRKQREKEQQAERDALAAAGIDISEEEQEKINRRRAEERMGQRHRESRWAKGIKEAGRAAWDEDARDGVTEMARRGEELRRRMEGKNVKIDQSGSEIESELSESEEDSEDDTAKLQRKLESVKNNKAIDASGPGSKLFSMKFMQNAEASRRRENDDETERIRRELAGEDPSGEEETRVPVGRRKMGPKEKGVHVPVVVTRDEFEEGSGTDDDSNRQHRSAKDDVDFILDSSKKQDATKSKGRTISHKPLQVDNDKKAMEDESMENPWLTAPSKGSQKRWKVSHNESSVLISAAPDPSSPAHAAGSESNISKTGRVSTVAPTELSDNGETDGDHSEDDTMPILMRNQDLVRKAFAGDEVVADFAKEKRKTIEEDDEKIIDETLPGWGNWAGSGISKQQKARNKGRILKKVEGIKENARKDAKLDRVIINEKRVKKNSKYLASSLPHPYESRQQYERALRLPVGPEWTTKETFQSATKPRVLLKQGVIAPMDNPLL